MRLVFFRLILMGLIFAPSFSLVADKRLDHRSDSGYEKALEMQQQLLNKKKRLLDKIDKALNKTTLVVDKGVSPWLSWQKVLEDSNLQWQSSRQVPFGFEAIQRPSIHSISDVKKEWDRAFSQLHESGRIREKSVTLLTPKGHVRAESVWFLGDVAAFSSSGFLRWLEPQQLPQIQSYDVLNQSMPLFTASSMTLDPTLGELVSAKKNLSWLDRIRSAGMVGFVILGIFGLALSISVWRCIALLVISHQTQIQLNNLDSPKRTNPLGRVFYAYEQNQALPMETVELRLLEVIVDEQYYLEKGLSFIKLSATVAPMLGLLGTVLGMIETFQMISVMGSGDPSVTAGGISTALITTVLGLIAAMPLLLFHNILSSQIERLRVILEKQSLGLIASRAERLEKAQTPIFEANAA